MVLAALLVAKREEAVEELIKRVFNESKKKIAIISDIKKIKNLKDHIDLLDESGTDIIFIRLSPKFSDMEPRFFGVFFDVILYDNLAGEQMLTKPITKHLHPKTVIVSNGDDSNIPDFIRGVRARAITYGLGQKCSVTPSCMDTDNYLRFNVCVQRAIQTLDGKDIEVGEAAICIEGRGHNIYDALAAVVLRLILS